MKTVLAITIVICLFIAICLLMDTPPFRKYRHILDLSISSSNTGLSDEIYSGHSANQEFVPNFDGLNTILIPMSVNEKAPKREVIFRLKDAVGSKKDMALCKIFTDALRKNKYQKFCFTDIESSRDRTFVLMVEAQDAEKADSIKVYITKDGIRSFQRYEGNNPARGIMQLITFASYNGNLKTEASNLFIKLAKDKPFLIVYSIMIWGIISTLIVLKVNSRLGGKL